MHAFGFGIMAIAPALGAHAQPVTTYHNTLLRSGWDKAETSLTVANVGGGGFDLQATTALDGQVDSQPLVMPNQTINGTAHTIIYVATSNDTLYAIDSVPGAVLVSRSFGTPVPQSALPGQCNNNGPTIGITSTPVIDPSTNTLYLVADTYENSAPVFRLHAVSLTTLQDTLPPVVVTASAKLTDGSSYTFNPTGSRQRAALLLSGHRLYAAFSSYCDQAQGTTRGWLLGWNETTLKPLPHNTLADATPVSQSGYFLNSIWMSGFGPSTAGEGQPIFVLTSNSDKNTYGAANRDESVLELSADLSGINSYFTDPNQANDDASDNDLGSGGALLLPLQPGQTPHLALGAGKAGSMYLFDRSTSPGLTLLGTYGIGGCWCGLSSFQGSDGALRVVSSGGSSVILWRLNTSSSAAASLTQQTSTAISSGGDPGFFTSVSSNGRKSGTAIIWAVGRPTSVPGGMPLYAIDPTSGKIIYTATAGHWVSGNSDSDTVPTIANGHVYVASYKELTIFGLGNPAKLAAQAALIGRTRAADAQARATPAFRLKPGERAVWGTIRSVTQSEMVLTDRHGVSVRVYLPTARAAGNLAAPVVGQAAVAFGPSASDGMLMATNVEHAKPSAAAWPADQLPIE